MMKAKVLVLVTFCVIAVAANAQFSIGVRGGLNVSSINEYGSYELDARAGAHGGIMMQYMFNKNIGVESGLYYSMMGGKDKEKDYDNPNRIDDYKTSANPSYLQLPLYAIYKFNISENLRLYPSLGVYLGYGLNGNIDIKGIEDGVDITKKDDFFNDDNNRFDVGAGIGFNIQYKKVVFGLGYEQGFMKINKHDFPYDDEDAYNSNVKLSVGFLIN